MTHSVKTITPVKYARLAGLLYLLIAIAGMFSIGYVPAQIVVAGDAGATAANIIAKQGLFLAGITGDVAVVLFEIMLTAMLYRMFKQVNSTITLIAAYARIGMTIIMGVNLFNHLLPLVILSRADYLTTFTPDQLHAASLLLLNAHQYGIYIWQLFFSLHLLALGYLVIRCGYYPKWLGWLMLTGSLGYAGDSMVHITSYEGITIIVNILLAISVVGELGFTFWLLIKGVHTKKLARPYF